MAKKIKYIPLKLTLNDMKLITEMHILAMACGVERLNISSFKNYDGKKVYVMWLVNWWMRENIQADHYHQFCFTVKEAYKYFIDKLDPPIIKEAKEQVEEIFSGKIKDDDDFDFSDIEDPLA